MLSSHRQRHQEGHWHAAKDPEGIEITLNVEHGKFLQLESLGCWGVEQNRLKTAAHLQTRLLVLKGTVK